MKCAFTLDDGLKGQMKFWNKTLIPSTYFVLPSSAEFKNSVLDPTDKLCSWSDVRTLQKHNEIGFHGFSLDYNTWMDERVHMATKLQLTFFQQEVGYKPKTFAYTDMRPGRLDIISTYFPYIRDYFWRDTIDGKQVFRIADKDVPEAMKPYRSKIVCIHPILDPAAMLRKLKEIAQKYEYCVVILHKIEEPQILMARVIKEVYDTCTFGQIFEGQSKGDNGGSPAPATVNNEAAQTGSTPVASPEKEEDK